MGEPATYAHPTMCLLQHCHQKLPSGCRWGEPGPEWCCRSTVCVWLLAVSLQSTQRRSLQASNSSAVYYWASARSCKRSWHLPYAVLFLPVCCFPVTSFTLCFGEGSSWPCVATQLCSPVTYQRLFLWYPLCQCCQGPLPNQSIITFQGQLWMAEEHEEP